MCTTGRLSKFARHCRKIDNVAASRGLQPQSKNVHLSVLFCYFVAKKKQSSINLISSFYIDTCVYTL